MARSKKFRDLLIEELKNPREAAAYFKAILEECKNCDEEEAKQLVLNALKNIADAQGGISELAAKTRLSRPSLYKALAPQGNPKLSTLITITQALLPTRVSKR